MNNYIIRYKENFLDNEIEFLTQGIINDSKEKGAFGAYEKFSLLLYNNKDELCGGCCGYIYFGSLHIDKLFVAKELRNKGLGSKLILETEKLARKKSCSFITVNTMNWQAGDFYLKNKFNKEFVRTGYINGYSLHWYRKDL